MGRVARARALALLSLLALAGCAGAGPVSHQRPAIRHGATRVRLSPTAQASFAPVVGQTLLATTGTWAGSPTRFTYQWEDCDSTGASCTTIVGASVSSYTVQGADIGQAIGCQVVAWNGQGSAAQSCAVTGLVRGPSPPVNTAEPYFTSSTVDGSDVCTAGCAITGQTLGVSSGTWSNSPTAYTYQWQDCATTSAQPPRTASCSNVTNGGGGSTGTAATYTVQAADVGHALVPIVTATNTDGSASTSVAGGCNIGLVPPGGIGAHTQFNYTAGCSPISAVAAATQAGEEFCTNSFTTCGFGDPFAGSAGVPLATSLSTTGACATWASGGTVSTPGTTIDGCKITGTLTVNANNVTIQNSDVSLNSTCCAAINVGASNTGFLLAHSTVHGPSASSPLAFAVSSTGTNGTFITLTADYVYNADRILSTAGIVQDSVCLGNGNLDSVGEHYECTYAGKGGPDEVLHSVLISNPDIDGASAFYAQGDFGTLHDITVQNSLLADGEGFCIDGGDTSGGGSGVTAGEALTGNRMSRIYNTVCGGFGVYAFIPSFATRTGNIWDDTLAGANSG